MHPETTGAPAPSEIDTFIADGFLRLDGAFAPDLAARMRDILWQAMGLSPDDPAAWTRPVVRIGHRSDPPFAAAASTPRLHAAYDALAGRGRWLAPTGLGSFPVRFPSADDPGDTGWHVDVSFGFEAPDYLDWRVNVVSRGRALLMLFLLSDTGPEDAPTLIRAGSHLRIARQLLPAGEAGMTLRELAADGFAGTADCAEVAATGPAGTVYLCHPFLVHRAQPLRSARPRFLAQPPLLPAHPFDPALPPSPVQVAIRRACRMT